MNDIKINSTLASEVAAAVNGAPAGRPATSAAPESDFTSLVKQSINEVNEVQQSAGNLAERFELGEPGVELSRVMVEMQRARVSFEALYQVRNKLVEAYREVMNMQV